MPENLVSEIGTVVIIAIGLAYVARILNQPLILAYVLAGIICGPKIGFGLVHDHNIHTIHSLGELGLIFLLFMIGLEINLKKLIVAIFISNKTTNKKNLFFFIFICYAS